MSLSEKRHRPGKITNFAPSSQPENTQNYLQWLNLPLNSTIEEVKIIYQNNPKALEILNGPVGSFKDKLIQIILLSP